MRSLVLGVFGVLGSLAACNWGNPGGNGDDTSPIDARAPGDALTGNGLVFDPAITSVTVEIDYEQGQAPFTGPIVGFGDTFDLTFANVDRVFAGTKQLAIPRTVANMQSIGVVADEELSVADLLALAQAHRSTQDSSTEKTYYVVFVSGYFADADGPNSSVLGVSIGTTGVIAMFKDVIRSSSAVSNIQRFVEQSTLVHELGHAIGLVNNGVPLVTAHHDVAHGAHCSNESCVMYWANEGAGAMAAWAAQYVLASNTIVFRAECLGDVDALTGGP